MKKKYQVLGLIVLLLCSIIYDFQYPEKIEKKKEKALSYVVLEGAFLKQGKYEYSGKKTVKDIVDTVGVTPEANLKALSLQMQLKDESIIYLPKKMKNSISLNRASKEELMKLERVGEKTALKIIEYRKKHSFICIEDIMNVPGIGEKTYRRLRDQLCL